MVKKMVTKSRGLNVVSFFSGCGGFDLGFEKAGFNIVLANDIWETAAKTFIHNFPNTEFILSDIRDLNREKILEILKQKNVEKVNMVIGGPPCQCFTRLNNNNLRRHDERNQLFKDYLRMIDFLHPDFVVMENVKDLLMRKDIQNKYFKDLIIQSFNRIGYKVSYKIFEMEKYGVPQKRKRVIFFATNKNVELDFPRESNDTAVVEKFLKRIKNKSNLKNHEFSRSGKDVLKRIKHIPPGGYYENLPENLKIKKIRKGELVTVKRYGSYFRRLKNDEPSMTVTTNQIIHPEENRFLTNREKATLHSFPENFEFLGTKGEVSQQIANAVPPEFAKRIAEYVLKKYYPEQNGF